MRILLVQPAPFEDTRLGLENSFWLSEPVALTSVAAMVPDHEVRVLDMRLEEPQALPQALAEFRPDIVGTTAMTTDAYQAKAVLRLARSVCPNAMTVIGGHHCTMMPEFYYEPFVDVIVKGEGEECFRALVDQWDANLAAGRPHDTDSLAEIKGTEIRTSDGSQAVNCKHPDANIDTLPAPARHLISQYKGSYFYLAAQPMASIFTSRGCSYDCNFCAIWEFYDRKTRYLSASIIVDRMEACDEPFIFFLDDNFLTRKDRIIELCDELERRGVKKYWMTQGRTDFVAKHPDLIARLAKNGMMGLLSGYESNDEDALAALRKKNTLDNNLAAARILKSNGIVSTGIFLVRPDFSESDFDELYEYILDLGVAVPLVTMLTPLPGTELFRAKRDDLLTEDFRLYDLLHPVVPTKLPRKRFYEKYVEWQRVSIVSRQRWFTWATVAKRWDFYVRALPSLPGAMRRLFRYQRVMYDADNYMRDEAGIIPPDVTMDNAHEFTVQRRNTPAELATAAK